jgi:fluoride exporter
MGFLFIETLERLTVSGYVRTGILTGFPSGFTAFWPFPLGAADLA